MAAISQFLAEIYIIFGPVLRQVIVLLNVAGAFL
jgi:hypothetical protein